MIKLTKMEGLGNDFVIFDYDQWEKSGMPMNELAKKSCDRHFGVGADGMIVPAKSDTADIGWYFYNADGTTAQMCGNGMRCFAKYAYDNGLVDKKSFSVETGAGIIKPEILDNGMVRVDMGAPIFEDAKIPFCGERRIGEFEIFPVSMGNPHCVIVTAPAAGAAGVGLRQQDEQGSTISGDTLEMAKKYGPQIENHPFFPEKTNVEFVKIISKEEIEMCVFERGCGITLACGTGACASVAACVCKGLTGRNVRVNLLGGTVTVEYADTMFLTGGANYVFTADYM